MCTKTLKLAIFDIDGTLRRVKDPWAHLHQHLGVAGQAAGFMGRWERGEISYEQWAQLDAALWQGHTRHMILASQKTNAYRAGARQLVGWFTGHNIPCVGISSGLSIFNHITAEALGFAEIISNELHFDGDICNGQISIRVSEETKAGIMAEVLARYQTDSSRVVAFGDGSADIPLLAEAGLGIAVFPANDRVRAHADAVIEEEPIDKAIAVVAHYFKVD